MGSQQQRVLRGGTIDARYVIEHELGTGGMATVYQVVDEATGKRLALKRLLDSLHRSPRHHDHLKQEFQTLKQLAHPHIVAAYDFGIDDDDVSYYTMELVQGQDVDELAPADWRHACGLLRQLASALALLHSRKLVHRDLSARNVRHTGDETVKLIDFGAMVPFGRAASLIGTPPFIAPESLSGLELDQRVDLYALGVLAYRLVTDQYPFAAADTGQLPELWKTNPIPLAELIPDLPEPISALVTELLSHDPLARPASAAEVMSRLEAVAHLPTTTQAAAQEAFLVTPRLVGRQQILEHAKGLRDEDATGGRVLLLEAAPGSGRTRVLEACGLELRVSGVTVLHARGAVGVQSFEIARELVGGLTPGDPASPGDSRIPEQPPDVGARGTELDRLTGLLMAAAMKRPLALSVDDLHLVDEPSLALLAGLASAPDRRFPMLLAVDPEAKSSSHLAMTLIRRAAQVHCVQDLDAQQTRVLLASVFGEIPRLELLAEVMHRVHAGNPRATMTAAAHLVDDGLARYANGRWFVANDTRAITACVEAAVDTRHLPGDMSTDASALLEVIALDEYQQLGVNDYSILCGYRDALRSGQVLAELIERQLISERDGRHFFHRPFERQVVRDWLSAEQTRKLHAKIARRLQANDVPPIYPAYHGALAGDLALSYTPMQRHLEILEARPVTGRELVDLETLERLVELGEQLHWPHALQARYKAQLIVVLAALGLWARIPPLAPSAMQALSHYCALPGHGTLGGASVAKPPSHPFGAASEPMSPGEAVRLLARVGTLVAVSGLLAFDATLFSLIPDLSALGKRFAAVDVAGRLIEYARCQVHGQVWKARSLCIELFAYINALPADAVDPRTRGTLQVVALSALCVNKCRYAADDAIALCDALTRFQPHIAEGYRVAYYMAVGDYEASKEARRQLEAISLQVGATRDSRGEMVETMTELLVLTEDLDELQRLAQELADAVAEQPGMRGTWCRVHAHSLRLCGRYDEARALLEESLSSLPDSCLEWYSTAEAHLRVLNAAGAFDEALRRGSNYLARARRLQTPTAGLDLAFAQTWAAVDAHDTALEHWRAALDALVANEIGGIHVGYAYEVGARIALKRGDSEAFEHNAAKCAQYLVPGGHPALVAKHERLLKAARRGEHTENEVTLMTETIARKRAHRELSEGSARLPSRLMLPTVTACPTMTAGATVDGRFEVKRLLGQGGLGEVHEVIDLRTGNTVALKRLRSEGLDSEAASRAQRLLQTEYQTLKQLQHPSVIGVYDYGVDPGLGPFYTMELLAGQDLRDLAPLPYSEVCALLVDVASSLGVVHSRGMVHRDVAAGNVRQTVDGRAKLLGFGALTEAGVPVDHIGTAPYVAPEVLAAEAIDGRADLYALGALGYFALTGRHAYPARNMDQLSEYWKTRPKPAHEFDASVPRALSELVAALMHPDKLARPQTAAEVMARLGAVMGGPLTESGAVQYAYLTTPRLLGRDLQISRVRDALQLAVSGQGAVLIAQGRQGSGRSRFLDACAVEAELVGALVVQSNAAEGGQAFGVITHVVRQLLEADALDGEAGHDLAEWLRGAPRSVRTQRERVLVGLHQHLLSLCARRPVVVVVDDIDHIDEPSLALLANLSPEAPSHGLCLLLSREHGARGESDLAMQWLCDSSEQLDLAELGPKDLRQLLASVFGEVPNLDLVTSVVQRACGGWPREVMAAVQRLVGAGVARYDGGGWYLTDAAGPIAACVESGSDVESRVAQSTDNAKELLAIVALDRDRKLTEADYAHVAAAADADAVKGALDWLVREQLLVRGSAGYHFARVGEQQTVVDMLAHDTKQSIHERIASRCNGNGASPLHECYHWTRAGRVEEAHRAMRRHFEVAETQPDRTRERIEVDAVQELLALGEQHHWPRARLTRYRTQLILSWAMFGEWERIPAVAADTLEALSEYSGLSDYWELPEAARSERLREALGRAKERFEQADEWTDPLSPREALRALPRIASVVAVCARFLLEPELFSLVPDFEPLTTLSPALSFSYRIVETYRINLAKGAHWQTWDRARALYADVLATPAEQLDARSRYTFELVSLSGVCLQECQHAAEGALASCDALSRLQPDQAENYRSLYHLASGDLEAAEAARKRCELLALRSGATDDTRPQRHTALMEVYTVSEDLIGLKRLVDELDEVIKVRPGWHFKRRRAQLQALYCQGQVNEALQGVLDTLQELPVPHNEWAGLAELHVHLLTEAQRPGDACEVGAAYLARARDLNVPTTKLELAVALALAASGQEVAAERAWTSALAALSERGVGGILVGYAYEVGATVALCRGDPEAFAMNARRCGEYYLPGRYPALAAKHERLLGKARAAVAEGDVS